MTALTQLRETLVWLLRNDYEDANDPEYHDDYTVFYKLRPKVEEALALLDRLEAEQLAKCADAVEVTVVKAGLEAKASSQTDFLLRR